MSVLCLTVACGDTTRSGLETNSQEYFEPSWEKFRSTPFSQRRPELPADYSPSAGRFVFADLKFESDESLSRRLLGELASRIVFIDRRVPRWQYYGSDSDPIHSVTLYSQPEPWGSAYGLCRIERYEVDFSDDGSVSSVDVSPRYGIEGPIFQKDNFDWDDFRGRMCDKVPANHTPSYFPVSDNVLDAHDLAILLSLAIDEAGRDGLLSYDLSCASYDGSECMSDVRDFLRDLRLHEINSVSARNCIGDAYNCFNVTVGKSKLGPNPKHLTIKGTTYMNDWRVQSISIVEGYTIS